MKEVMPAALPEDLSISAKGIIDPKSRNDRRLNISEFNPVAVGTELYHKLYNSLSSIASHSRTHVLGQEVQELHTSR